MFSRPFACESGTSNDSGGCSHIGLGKIHMKIVSEGVGMIGESLCCPSTKLLGPSSISSLLFLIISIFYLVLLYQKYISFGGFLLAFLIPFQHQVLLLLLDPFLCLSLLLLSLFSFCFQQFSFYNKSLFP